MTLSVHIKQTEAYIQLVEAVGQTPQNLIANPQNAISQEAITQFLAPLANITDGQNLIDADVIRINDALALPDDGRGSRGTTEWRQRALWTLQR